MKKVLFINDVISVTEQSAPAGTSGTVLHIEVDTAGERQVLSLPPSVARQLLAGLEHALKNQS